MKSHKSDFPSIRSKFALLGSLIFFATSLPQTATIRALACTTAVISGRSTEDGRPILWKNRDTTSSLHNEVIFLNEGKFKAMAVVNAGQQKSVWMGTNEAGFCIENSLSTDLASSGSKGPGNGSLMRIALQQCKTVDDFQDLLDKTNATGRTTTANFGVIDALGGAAMFETGPTSYQKFDANDPLVAPHGYVVRSNFATTAQDLPPNPDPANLDNIASAQRYLRACDLLDARLPEIESDGNRRNGIGVSYVLRNLTRDMADPSGRPIPGTVNAGTVNAGTVNAGTVNAGTANAGTAQTDALSDTQTGVASSLPNSIETSTTISRTTTVSSVVFHGVRPGENPSLTTMWTILGDPKFSIAVPCFVASETIADPLTDDRGGELGEIAITLRDWSLAMDRQSVLTTGLPGIWSDLWKLEDKLVADTLAAKERWNREGFESPQLTQLHIVTADEAMEAMKKELREAKIAALTPEPPRPIRVAIYDHSSGTANGPKNLLRFLTKEAGFDSIRVRPEDIRNEKLVDFDVLIVPGGSGSQQAEMLEELGREKIRTFVDQGGGYIGICAGAYLASSHYSWSLNLLNARVWDRVHWARGNGTVSLRLSNQGSQFFDAEDPTVDVLYAQGPLMIPGNNPDLPRYDVLAVYETEIATKGAPPDAMVGTHAIARGVFGRGRVMAYSPHPEASGGPNWMIIEGVRWVANGITPIKSTSPFRPTSPNH